MKEVLIVIETNKPWWWRLGTVLLLPYQLVHFVFTGKAEFGKWEG